MISDRLPLRMGAGGGGGGGGGEEGGGQRQQAAGADTRMRGCADTGADIRWGLSCDVSHRSLLSCREAFPFLQPLPPPLPRKGNRKTTLLATRNHHPIMTPIMTQKLLNISADRPDVPGAARDAVRDDAGVAPLALRADKVPQADARVRARRVWVGGLCAVLVWWQRRRGRRGRGGGSGGSVCSPLGALRCGGVAGGSAAPALGLPLCVASSLAGKGGRARALPAAD